MPKPSKKPGCAAKSCGQSRQSEEVKRIADSITRYYDSLTDAEVAEDRAWGLFAEGQMAEPQ